MNHVDLKKEEFKCHYYLKNKYIINKNEVYYNFHHCYRFPLFNKI